MNSITCTRHNDFINVPLISRMNVDCNSHPSLSSTRMMDHSTPRVDLTVSCFYVFETISLLRVGEEGESVVKELIQFSSIN